MDPYSAWKKEVKYCKLQLQLAKERKWIGERGKCSDIDTSEALTSSSKFDYKHNLSLKSRSLVQVFSLVPTLQ